MAVIDILPADGKVVAEGPVGCSVEVCDDDFRHLDIGLPPEILRLKDAGYLTQAVAACDRLLKQNPDPSFAACVRAERYRMIETPLHFSVSRDRAIEMIREELPEFTDKQFDDLIDRKRIDWRFIDGELFVLDNFLDSLRVYPKKVPGLRPDPTDSIALRNQMLEEMETQGGLSRTITLKACVSVPGALEGEAVRAWLPVAAACRQQSQIEILDMTPEGVIAPANALARTASWVSSTDRSFSVIYRYQIDAAYHDIYGGALPAHPCMDTSLPEDISEDRPHIAFTPYLQQLTERVVDGLEDQLDRARAIYDYLTLHIDYRYQPPYLLLGSIADDCAHSLRGDCGVMALTFITMCRIAGVPARWQSGLYVAPDSVGPHDWAEFYTPQTGWLNADVSFGSSARRMGEEWHRRHYFGNLDPWRMVANSRFQAGFEPVFDGMREDPYDNQMGEVSVDGRGCRRREMLRSVELIEMFEVPFSD